MRSRTIDNIVTIKNYTTKGKKGEIKDFRKIRTLLLLPEVWK